ncbi:MAG: transposase [Paracoccaceae bacterium]
MATDDVNSRVAVITGTSRPYIATCKALNWRADNKALMRRGSLTIWFDPGMARAAKPTGQPGRHPVYSYAAVEICLTMKGLFGMALSRTTGSVKSLSRLAGLDWDA